MTHSEYLQLSSDLQQLVKKIPLHWGSIQNDGTDQKVNMFKINSFEDLEIQIQNLSNDDQNYFRRRWFLWKCAQCDEYIFCQNNNVTPNPNSKSQDYDIEFNGNSQLRFDIKGTVVPKKFRDTIDAVLNDPSEMIRFFYEKQSRGVRDNIQNRLFIIHHSFRNPEREMYLRCHWDFKTNLYQEYASRISQTSNFIGYQNVKTDIIFIFENTDKSISHKFF
jgi:DNA-binding transcriptional regulator/RsmH inhibitor MraZ